MQSTTHITAVAHSPTHSSNRERTTWPTQRHTVVSVHIVRMPRLLSPSHLSHAAWASAYSLTNSRTQPPSTRSTLHYLKQPEWTTSHTYPNNTEHVRKATHS